MAATDDTRLAADLETEIRRLRLRIMGLSGAQLGAAGEGGVPRREAIVRALGEFSRIGSGGREVPRLGDRALADQVTVLLGECAHSPGEAVAAAVALRRALA